MSDVAMKLAEDAANGDASGSASPWPEDKPALSGKEQSKMEDTIRRFRYLLGLTDLFKHFIDIRSSEDPAFRKLIEETEASTKRNQQLKSGNHRRRKTEKEEDSELLEEERDDSTQTTVFTESPQFINGVMRDYQVQGLNWLINLHENGISGILADEMGLGKTLQSISFLAYLRYVCGIQGPHIIIVPKSTLDNWAREFSKWTPDVKVLVFQGDKHERARLVSERLEPLDFDVCITSYEVVIREKSRLRKISWEYIIIDEAHRIKNEDSMLSQIIRLFTSRNRLLITGTPLQNNLHELWALLNFILPDVFVDSQTFDRWFEDQSNDQDAVVKQLHKVLKPFLLRRVKSDVEKSLLPKKEVNLYVGMSEMQKRWYRKILEKDIDAVNGAVGKRESKTRLLNIVMQLRKCCNHPYLFEGAEPGPPYTTDVHLIENAGKMVILDKLLRQLKEKGSRVLIFSQMSRLLDILEDYCSFREYEYCRIDGSTDHADRIAAIDDYNKPNSDKFVFLLTTRAGGLGINLTTADTVILYDSDWNPQADLQAMDRAHRIGQTKQVRVFRFVSENTVEEKVLERATQKLRLDQLVIQQGRAQTTKTAPTSKDDLLNMIQYGAEAMFESSNPSSTVNGEDDIEAILQRSEAKTSKLNERYSNLGIDDLQKFSSDSAYEWNGEDFKKKNANIGITWIAPSRREAKRDRGDTNYSIEGYYKGALHTGGRTSGPAKLPKPPKQINIQDHHFFPKELAEIQHRETLYFRKENGIRAPLPPPGPGKHQGDDLKEREAEQEKAQKEIDDAEPVTEEDEKRKNELAAQGFSNWTRRDFTHFIHLSAKYGRRNYKAIASELEGKSEQEVRQYANTFWKRCKEIDGYERYISQIEAGEERAKRINRQRELLRKKISQYKSPLRQMQIRYPQNNSKRVYTEEEDRFLLIQLNRIGLDNESVYELIRDEIRKHPLFRFDWFFLSRLPIELSRRCSTLLTAVVRELDGPKKRRSVAYNGDGIVEDEEDDNPDDDYEEEDEEDDDGKPSHKSGVNGASNGHDSSYSRSVSVASDMPSNGHNRKKPRLE